ncbi:MAG: hypothetical protein IPJ01_12040 [Micavibrio sp.]|nr:hypothetical protein [Micavibrio sp.]
MNDFTSEIKDAINAAANQGLKLAADEFNTRTDIYTPFWKGRLQRSKIVRTVGPGAVDVVSGNAETADYIEAQYNLPQRHRGNFETGLQDLTALHPDGGASNGPATKQTKKAGTNKPVRKSKRPALGIARPMVKPGSARITPRATGGGEKALYARAYRLAIANNQLTPLDAPRWYERGAENPALIDDMAQIFVGSVGGKI